MRTTPLPLPALPLLAVLVALVVAGCGSASEEAGSSAGASGSASSSPSADTTIEGCAPDSPQLTSARTLTRADLDGDGTREAVRLTAPGGTCGGTVFAQVGDTVLSARLPGDEPPVTSAYAVTVPGVEGDLLVTTQQHPRGGFQTRVFGGSGTLTEVEVAGRPLVPFVATDVQEQPLSVDCGKGSLVLTEAVAHEPVGVVPAFDVRRTTYALDRGGDGSVTLTKGSTREIADNVLDRQLGQAYPALVGHRMFPSCRAAG